MATWEYTELKLKKQTDFILRNVEKLHFDKEPYDGCSDHWAFPKKNQNQLRGLRNIQPQQLHDLEAGTEEQRSSNIEWKTWSPCVK